MSCLSFFMLLTKANHHLALSPPLPQPLGHSSSYSMGVYSVPLFVYKVANAFRPIFFILQHAPWQNPPHPSRFPCYFKHHHPCIIFLWAKRILAPHLGVLPACRLPQQIYSTGPQIMLFCSTLFRSMSFHYNDGEMS